MVKALLIFVSFLSMVFAEEGKHSPAKVIKYENANEGNMKFTYMTYLDGEEGYKVGYLHGKIEITDLKE